MDFPDETSEIVLPLHEETIDVQRVRTESAVRVDVINKDRVTRIEAELQRERVEITRVPIGRIVEQAPAVREENGVTIVPVMEEVLISERRLMLKEEVHIRRVHTSHTHTDTIVLRTQDIVVSRTEPSPGNAT